MSTGDWHDRYLAEVHRVLGLTPLAAPAPDTALVARALFRPSFHPECAVTLLVSRETAELVVASATRSIWGWWNVIQGEKGYSPVGFVEPASAVERIELRARDVDLDVLRRPLFDPPQPHSGVMLDGMGFTYDLRADGRALTADDRTRRPGVSSVVEAARHLQLLALGAARWEQSRKSLAGVGWYFG